MVRVPLPSHSFTLHALLAMAVAGVPLFGAERAATQPTPTTSASSNIATSATRPAIARPAALISLSFKDAPLDTVLDYLSTAAGFVIVKEAPVEGRVTLVSRQPISSDEAVMVLDTVLKSNGYAAVRQGRILKIVSQDKAKKSSAAVHIGADPAAIEATDEIITQIIPVVNIDAAKLKADLSPVIGADADVTANGGSNAIVITDTSANVKRDVEMIAALDQHESGNYELRRYVLKNANAVAATRLLVAIFKPDDAKPANNKTPASEEPSIRGKINAVADDRTNTIYVTASKETLLVVDGILKELDANSASASAIKIFPLKYADAAAAVKLLSAIFKPEDLKVRFPGEPPPKPSDIAVKVNAAADDRTNSVVVAAPLTETLAAIEDILKRLDADPSSISETRVIPLLNADAVSTAKLLTAVYKTDEAKPPSNPYLLMAGNAKPPGVDQSGIHINAVADDRTNSVVITAPTETLKGILDILKTLDGNPATSSTIKVFQLKFADATAVVKLITTIFKSDETQNSNSAANAAAPTAKVQGVSEQEAKIKVTAAADDRTNTLVVSAPVETMKVVEEIIKNLDANPAADQSIFIYKLKNGQSLDLEPVLNAVFGNTSGVGSGQRQNRPQQNLSSLSSGFSGGSGSSGFGSSSGSGFGGSSGSGFGGSSGSGFGGSSGGFGGSNRSSQSQGMNASYGGGGASGLSQSAARTAGELAGQVSIVAEPDTNSLIISTAAKYMDRVKTVIDELDRPVPQVLIKVLIAEVTHDNSIDAGVDWSILNQRASGKGLTLNSTFGSPNTGVAISLLEDNLTATLHALAIAGKVDVLSRPYILASDNQLATMTIGSEVPIITDSRVDPLGGQINTVQYRDIGIILNVTPHINPDGLVICDIAPEVSATSDQNVPISSTVSAPVFSLRSANTRVGIKDGQTIVIGGLMQDQKTTTVNKIPLLGDIPWLGVLFSRTEITKTKTELLFFITPHVALAPENLQSMSQDEIKGTKLTPREVEPGMYEEHMRGLQRGDLNAATQPAGLPR